MNKKNNVGLKYIRFPIHQTFLVMPSLIYEVNKLSPNSKINMSCYYLSNDVNNNDIFKLKFFKIKELN